MTRGGENLLPVLFLRRNLGRGEAFDVRAESAKLVFELFVAAIEMVNAVDVGGAAGNERGENQRCAGA